MLTELVYHSGREKLFSLLTTNKGCPVTLCEAYCEGCAQREGQGLKPPRKAQPLPLLISGDEIISKLENIQGCNSLFSR